MHKNEKWLNFPISVFIDSQVFIQESYDFGSKGKLSYFKRLVDNGKVKLLTSIIVKREVEHHLKTDLEKGVDN